MPKKTYYPSPGDDTATTRSKEFARRLGRAMLAKGWNQSDLARAAEAHLPAGKKFGRHLVSTYVTGQNLPTALNLTALAKALGVDPRDLVPDYEAQWVGEEVPPVDIKALSGGRARLKVDMEVDFAVAVQIAAMLVKKAD